MAGAIWTKVCGMSSTYPPIIAVRELGLVKRNTGALGNSPSSLYLWQNRSADPEAKR